MYQLVVSTHVSVSGEYQLVVSTHVSVSGEYTCISQW